MEFDYEGIRITCDAGGHFVATVKGARVRKPSLQAMKKHIDEMGRIKFKPFTALCETTYMDKDLKGAPGYMRVEVIGIAKNTQRYSGGRKHSFMVIAPRKDGGEPHASEAMRTLYEDTPENLALLVAEEKKRKEKEKAVERFDEEIDALSKKQKRIDPDSYSKKEA